MTDKERLVELIIDAENAILREYPYTTDAHRIERVADYLLENGVIVPPCKVGDIVWKIEDVWHLDDKETWAYHYEKEVVEFMVRSISISCNSKGVWTKKIRICQVHNGKIIDDQRNIEFDEVGKTVFFDREEAEKALAERSAIYETQ